MRSLADTDTAGNAAHLDRLDHLSTSLGETPIASAAIPSLLLRGTAPAASGPGRGAMRGRALRRFLMACVALALHAGRMRARPPRNRRHDHFAAGPVATRRAAACAIGDDAAGFHPRMRVPRSTRRRWPTRCVPHHLAYFAHNQWAETPPQMLEPLWCARWKRPAPSAPCSGRRRPQTSTLGLRTEILDLVQDFTQQQPVLRLSLRVRLSDEAATARWARARSASMNRWRRSHRPPACRPPTKRWPRPCGSWRRLSWKRRLREASFAVCRRCFPK